MHCDVSVAPARNGVPRFPTPSGQSSSWPSLSPCINHDSSFNRSARSIESKKYRTMVPCAIYFGPIQTVSRYLVQHLFFFPPFFCFRGWSSTRLFLFLLLGYVRSANSLLISPHLRLCTCASAHLPFEGSVRTTSSLS